MVDNRDVLVAIANNLRGAGVYEKPYALEVNNWGHCQDDGGARLVDGVVDVVQAWKLGGYRRRVRERQVGG